MKKSRVSAIVPALLSLALLAGVLTVFSACARREDGGWMPCHQCQNTVAASAGGLALVFGVSAFVKKKPVAIGLQLLATIASAVVFFIPGGICPMCMMKTMRCSMVFQPFTQVMSGLIGATGLGSVVLNAIAARKVAA